ncbi:hypothetical protein CCACVL1_07998 [Corchorus capsularis]|uniref:Uncharacterized protein n=1 Tax=Corchorus capsularis TaxID=210143 RepID=A0A1R3J2T0_COCAP|nr:hypothetical protein CCACVL1_07998 [Corchorus capsularis]
MAIEPVRKSHRQCRNMMHNAEEQNN